MVQSGAMTVSLILSYKDWTAKKVTIFNLIVHLVEPSENILFLYLHFIWLCS